MPADDKDFDRVHAEFLRQRMAELESEFEEHTKQTGFKGLTIDKFTPERWEQWSQYVADTLRETNSELADRYASVTARARLAWKEVEQFMALRLERDWTDLERAQADVAERSFDEASEDLERIRFEVNDYLKSIDEKGGEDASTE